MRLVLIVDSRHICCTSSCEKGGRTDYNREIKESRRDRKKKKINSVALSLGTSLHMNGRTSRPRSLPRKAHHQALLRHKQFAKVHHGQRQKRGNAFRVLLLRSPPATLSSTRFSLMNVRPSPQAQLLPLLWAGRRRTQGAAAAAPGPCADSAGGCSWPFCS